MDNSMVVNKQLPRVLPFLLMMAIGLTACSESKWQTMADDELAAKSSECMGIDDPGPAMIQVCKNVKRECESRRENGIFAC
jgi:hypothetical protein